MLGGHGVFQVYFFTYLAVELEILIVFDIFNYILLTLMHLNDVLVLFRDYFN